MKVGQAFPSKYLKAVDLQGRHIVLTIDSVEMANIGDDEDKLVVYFEGKQKGFVLNRTNANMITEIAHTDETDEWKGTKIKLYPCRVDFQGRRVDAIRVDYASNTVTPNQRPEAAPALTPQVAAAAVGGTILDSDDVPFAP